ncbi:MAG TPA: ABC transporter permease [Gemmatimonadales bacterium]|jgi:predicted permease|nr:ABC transporter permease [Gemmatimonadales bacterium]
MSRRDGYDDERLPLSKTPPVADDVRRELEFHLEERIAELVRSGIPLEQARRVARESFGNASQVEAECRAIERRRRKAVRRVEWLGAFWQDLVVGFRTLRKSPGFTLTAVLTLGMGTGAVAAMFSIVNRVLLRPLPYPEPRRLVTVEERHAQGSGSVPWANFLDLEARARSFSAMASYGAWTATVLGTGQPLRVRVGAVSAGFFKVFPLRPELGRLPVAEEHRLGASPVAVVSHAFWRDALGSPRSLEGVRLRLGWDLRVVGVLPPGFDFPERAELWAPLELLEQSMSRTSHNWDVVGRLRPGVAREAAARELDLILGTLKPQYAPDFDATGSLVTGLQQAETGGLARPLWLLLAAAAVFLLAACSNLASGILARGTARLGELTVRSALGATRVRLARQLLTESALLAGLGAAASLGLALLLLYTLTPLAPARLRMDRVGIDGWVAGFALVVAVATTLLFGLFPALRLSTASTVTALREAAVGMASARRMRAWNVLVAAEVALAVALLSGSVLLIKSFDRVMQTELGFDPQGVVALAVDLPSVNYPGRSSKISAFHLAVLERLAATPGVTAAGFVNMPPLLSNGPSGSMVVEGKPFGPSGRFTGYSIYRVIGGDYFRAMGMPVLKGRAFGPGDDAQAPKVVIVDEAFAREQWRGEEPLGKRVKPAGMDSNSEDDAEPWYTVIGVVPSVRSSAITSAFRPTYYFDHRQRPPYRSASVTYAIRAGPAPAGAFAALRQAIRAVDPEVPTVLQTMDELVLSTVADRRFTMLVLGTFGALALLLALVGIYGVVSYAVAQRTREIGVRRALGATPGRVRAMVLSTTLAAVVPGLVVGALLTLVSARALGALLYGVSPFDPPTLAFAVAALGAAALLASLVPAWRAVRVDPLIAMRAE